MLELPSVNHIRKKKKTAAGQQGDLDPAGASNSAGGEVEEKSSSGWRLVPRTGLTGGPRRSLGRIGLLSRDS